MILMSTYALGEIPFKNVYLHGLVRDEQGRKISKSLGNNIDPQDMIAKYGTDAIRLSLLVGSAPGQDTRLSEAKIEGFRNFTNKLWNIARFMLMQLAEPSSDNGPVSLADEWILARLQQTIQDVTKKFEAYEFSTAAELLRDFTWNDVADWYLEIAKVEKNKHAILGQLLQSLLKMWHPFMPFVTEELWQRAKFDGLLMVAEWPSATVQEAPSSLFNSLRQLVTDMRRLRLEKNVDATKKVIFAIASDDARQLELVRGQSAWMERLTNAQELQFIDTLPTDWPTVISGSLSVALDLSGAIDVEAEQARLQKEIESTQAYVSSLESRLANQEFISKAPAKVVDDMRAKLSEAQAKLAQLDGRIKND